MQKPSDKVTAHVPSPQAEEQDTRKAEVADESTYKSFPHSTLLPAFLTLRENRFFLEMQPQSQCLPSTTQGSPFERNCCWTSISCSQCRPGGQREAGVRQDVTIICIFYTLESFAFYCLIFYCLSPSKRYWSCQI